MVKDRLYGIPTSLREESINKEHFNIPFEKKENNYTNCVECLITSGVNAKKFLRNPDEYLNKFGITGLKIDLTSPIYSNLFITVNEEIINSIKNRDSRKFVDELTNMNFLPKNFILNANQKPEPRVAWVPVVVTPAVVYVHFGVLAYVGAIVAGVTYIGVKTSGPKYLKSEWKSIHLNEKVARTLALAKLLVDDHFAKEVDTIMYGNFEEEMKQLINNYKLSLNNKIELLDH
jgi:hypothetical protein